MSVRKEAPKSRKRAAGAEEIHPVAVGEAEAANETAEPQLQGVGLHPIFGRAKVATVLVSKVRYRSGNERSPPIKMSCGPMDPAALIDSSQLLPLHGPGRYELRAIDANGLTAHPAMQFDVHDESGEILPYLVAPLPGSTGAMPSPGGTAYGSAELSSVAPRIDPLVAYMEKMTALSESARANDLRALQAMYEGKANGGGGGDSTMMVFLQGEVSSLKVQLLAKEKRIDDLRDEVSRLKEEKAARRGGDSQMMERVGMTFLERLTGSGSKASGPAQAVEGDTFEMPSVEQLRVLLQTSKIPQSVLVQAMKLRAAGGIDDERWAVIEPVLRMVGLITD